MAARRRDRRNSESTTKKVDSSILTSSNHVAAKSFVSFNHILLILFILLSIFLVYHYRPSLTVRELPEDLSVHDGGFVKTKISPQEILSEHSRDSINTTKRSFVNHVLAYVTPWNSLGYEMAEKFASKFTHVSPVWYDLKSEGKKLVLEGRHNADSGWISKIRANGGSLVLPRVVLEVFSPEFLLKKQLRSNMIKVIVNECKDMGYDGIVLESWSRWTAYDVLSDTTMRNKALQFINQLGKALHSEKNTARRLNLIYVIPAPSSQDLKDHDFGPDDLQKLGDVVDGFSLMTYDFSSSLSPGPNAPLIWIRSCLQILLGNNDNYDANLASKIFLGINFYGNDFVISEGSTNRGGTILGRDYISLLEKHQPTFQWEKKSSEHFFIYSHDNDRHAVFYPTLLSMSMRLDEARSWGASLSIWEIGQGLNYFFDLL
ncbi:Chitinase, family GH18 [Zostera marina]|uniref:Chitinase domain-containing protein 1 n=1 Tax=Zostera marina TaxID=29655 RepID=A0A0K9NKF6_ZOSMR|nr:Chitinase, family GH18 [Zostera marina]